MKVSKITCLLIFLVTCHYLRFPIPCDADQISSLDKLIKSRRSQNPPNAELWDEEIETRSGEFVQVYLGPQEGLTEADKIKALPGQPDGVDFDQYGGYVTVDPTVGRALFYYFVESPHNSSSKPLLLWLNGGPGCSSLGFGAMQELGPFRVNSDKRTLSRNEYAWNDVANVLFLESPAGVGFSYSNRSSDYDTGDKKTAKDSYVFLLNWLERFPQYKTRDFFIAGESYAGHYAPQLAYTILSNNKHTNQTVINLKGIAIGNAWIDENKGTQGIYDYYWTHALNSDETYEAINKHCDYDTGNYSNKCFYYQNQGERERGDIDIYNIYAPLCDNESLKSGPPNSVSNFDPCSTNYVRYYLNQPEVQKALHARNTSWTECVGVGWTESPITVLPTIKQLIRSKINIWIYSGDTDARVPITSSRYAIKTLKLPVETAWRPWYHNKEVGGYVEGYDGVVLVTVRGAGHTVPSYQPDRALAMISSFLKGNLPPFRSDDDHTI